MYRQCARWKEIVIQKAMLMFFFSGGAALAVGAPAENKLFGTEQWDITRVFITLLFAIIAFFLVRTLNKFDRNQDALFERMREQEKLTSELKGRCDALACKE